MKKTFFFIGAAITLAVTYKVLTKKAKTAPDSNTDALPKETTTTTTATSRKRFKPTTPKTDTTTNKPQEEVPETEIINTEDNIDTPPEEDNYEEQDFKFKRFAAQESTLDLRFA